MTKDDTAFRKITASSSKEMQELALAVRQLIYEVEPKTVEVVWEQQKIAGFGTGPKKMTEHFSWVSAYTKHVALGFNYGSELPDPEGLLEGSGKLMRHIKIKSKDDLQNPAVRAILQKAVRYRVPEPA
jgi:hypothetical protein